MKNNYISEYVEELRFFIDSNEADFKLDELKSLLNQLGKVIANSSEIESHRYKEILKYIPFGILFLDKNFQISNDYSESCKTIFEKESLGGHTLIEALGELVPQQLIADIKDFISLSFNTDLDINDVTPLNPINDVEITILTQDAYLKTKRLHFSFHRIFRNKEIDQLMVFVFDSFEKSELESQLQDKTKEYDRQVELFFQLMSTDPEQFAEYITDIELEVHEIQSLLKESTKNISLKKKLDELQRSVNYILEYGKALNVEKIFSNLYKLSEILKLLSEKEDLQSNDFFSFLFVINEFQKSINEIKSFNEKFLIYKKNYTFEKNVLSKELKEFIEKKVQEYAKNHAVSLKLNFQEISKLEGKILSLTKYIIEELIQFSFNYSIHEEVKDASIQVRIQSHSINHITLTYFDNGNGLEYEDLKYFYDTEVEKVKPFFDHFLRIQKKTKQLHPKVVVDSSRGEFFEFNITFRIS
jgi:hypothetical protein